MPVIADTRVERDFGSGALKITPGHDPLDFEIGRDHGLPEPMVIGPDGLMNEEAGDLAGMTQADADAASSPGSGTAGSSSSGRVTGTPSGPASGATRGSSR